MSCITIRELRPVRDEISVAPSGAGYLSCRRHEIFVQAFVYGTENRRKENEYTNL